MGLYHTMAHKPHDIYDNYTKWAECYEQPHFDVAAFQKKIDKIIGTTTDGKPIVRLMWAWNSREWIAGEWRAKYRFMTVPVPGGTVDIAPPRWVLEDRNEPGQYWDAWERGRFFTDPETKKVVDLRGEPPREGWYSYCELIAIHDKDKVCCDYLWETERRRCWGFYRLPNQKDLTALKRAKHLRDQQPENSPHEPLSDRALAEIGREAFTRFEKQERKRQSDLEIRLRDAIKPHSHRLEALYVDGNLVIRPAQ